MPTYEYQCNECEHRFEQFQLITAKPIRKCPQCDKNKVRRLIGCGAGVIFKGSGFYETDYRSENYKKAAQADTKNTTEKTKSDKKTDSKSKSSDKKTTPKKSS